MFEGVPNYPTTSRFWEVIDKHQVNIFYTAPTAIRALMQGGDEPVKKTSRKSLAPARHRRRADQSGSLAVVLPRGRRGPLPDRRHLVADRDRRHPDHAAAGRDALKPGSATQPFFGVMPQIVDADGKELEGRRQRQSVHRRFLARPDAHGLRRPRALHPHLLHDLSRQVLHRRRLPPRRGRLLLDHRPRRRRDQRLRPSPRHRRGRERAGRRIRRCRRPPWSAIRTTSRARASTPM